MLGAVRMSSDQGDAVGEGCEKKASLSFSKWKCVSGRGRLVGMKNALGCLKK